MCVHLESCVCVLFSTSCTLLWLGMHDYSCDTALLLGLFCIVFCSTGVANRVVMSLLWSGSNLLVPTCVVISVLNRAVRSGLWAENTSFFIVIIYLFILILFNGLEANAWFYNHDDCSCWREEHFCVGIWRIHRLICCHQQFCSICVNCFLFDQV